MDDAIKDKDLEQANRVKLAMIRNNARIAEAVGQATKAVITQRLPVIKGLNSLLTTNEIEMQVHLKVNLEHKFVRAELRHGVLLTDSAEIPI